MEFGMEYCVRELRCCWGDLGGVWGEKLGKDLEGDEYPS